MSWKESVELGQAAAQADGADFAEDAITLWSNMLAVIALHLRDTGTSREEILAMLTMLQAANDETIRSPRVRALAVRRLMAVHQVLADT